MQPIQFVDTTIRDGNMSLWACNLRTGMIMPVMEQFDRVGFIAQEVIASAFFKKLVRELKDDPWERLRLINKHMPNTPMRAIMGRSVTAFEFTPHSVTKLFIQRLAANGIREVRISDSSNTVANWQLRLADYQEADLKTIINLIYSISPVHTDDYYRERTREAAKLGADRLCLKDPGGLLTPERTRDLAQVMLAEAGDTPLEFHTHCITGLGPICALEAIQAGIGIINTATPPLANASSNPSVFNVCENAQALGYSPAIDLEALKPISEHFEKVAQQNSFPIGTPAEYSQASYMHQVPGGMISNLRHQLGLINHADKLDQVLEETARVREELGYPIMVTPYSQFVGAQAVMNVIMGERYKQISDQVIQYAMGFWGEEERGAVDKNLLDRICTSPRARELEGWQIPEPSIEEVRKQMGGTDLDGDEFLLHFFAGGEAVAAMRAAPPPSEYSVDGTQPVVTLIKELMKKPNFSSVRIEGDGLALHLVSSKQ